MKQVTRCYELLSQLSKGELYSWDDLKDHSRSPGRDVKRLLDEGLLNKVGPGLYLSPQKSRFGSVPASAEQVVTAFLQTDDYLLFSTNLYNSLKLGLTQLKNETMVYNKKRHGGIMLSNRTYHFKVKPKGFPKKLTKEYLLIDLVNNLDMVGESPTDLLKKIAHNVESNEFNRVKLFDLAREYGHVYTKKFFYALELGEQYPLRKSA